ncbi:MAG: aminotransferase class I/II-fold pyridoxal phosphate-dependent enzyme [Vicinamibacterales bacterium]
MIRESGRVAGVQAPVIPIIGRWIAETPGTITLGQGVVSFGPPPEALEAARRFGGAPDDHLYGPVEGLPELVDAIERKLRADNGITVRPDSRVVVTAGGNLAFMNAMLAVTDPGDEVILPSPYYFNHEMAVALAGARTVAVPVRPDTQLDLDAIAAAITPRTRAIVTVSPNNPTGAVYPEADLRAVNALCERHGVWHVHDEAYEYFVYAGATRFSPGAIPGAARHTISLYSLSKSFGMASWRVGYQVIPETLWEAVNKVQDTMLICAPAVSQQAALAAIARGAAWPRAHLPALEATRREVAAALAPVADVLEAPVPGGAFFFFVRLRDGRDRGRTIEPLALAERLIRQHRVAVIPGSAFGTPGPAWRLSFGALPPDRAVEGATRLARGIRALLDES